MALVRLALVACVLATAVRPAAGEEGDSLAAETLAPGSVDPRALAEAGADRWRRGRLRVAVVAGADSLAELFASAGPVSAAVRADTGRRNAWLRMGGRRWRCIGGGVRATFATGAVLGRAGSALSPASSPPRSTLVRVSPSTSLWLPTRGAAALATHGSLRLAAVGWVGEESMIAVMGACEGARWRAGVLSGRVSGAFGRERLGSVALGVRDGPCDALLELGARGGGVHATMRASFGGRPRWTLELGTSAAAPGFGAATAAPAVDARRRTRLAVTRSGRAGPVSVRASVWSVNERDLDETRRRLRCEVETRWRAGAGRMSAGARFDTDERIEPPLVTEPPSSVRAHARRIRLRAGYEIAAGALRQSLRVTVLSGPDFARGTLLEWALRWNGRRAHVAARVSAAALGAGQMAWFVRPDMLGREGLGVATGTVSDAALRAGVSAGGFTLTAWVGAGSRRGARAYVGAQWRR